MAPDTDFVELKTLALCYARKLPLPSIFHVNSRNITVTSYLESLVSDGRTACPLDVTRHLAFVTEPVKDGARPTVASVAAELLTRFRQLGQLPDTTAKPVPVNARDDIEGLGQLARAYRAERPVPHEVRIGGGRAGTVLFLEGFVHDRRECPNSIAADAGVSNFPASMREVATSLLGRLRQAGQL